MVYRFFSRRSSITSASNESYYSQRPHMETGYVGLSGMMGDMMSAGTKAGQNLKLMQP